MHQNTVLAIAIVCITTAVTLPIILIAINEPAAAQCEPEVSNAE